MATTQEKWAERVRAWRSSGKSAEEFASELDFESSTLRYWASRLKKSAAASVAGAPIDAAAKRPRTQATAMIARVVRKGADGAAGVEVVVPTLEVVVGSVRVAVRPGFDPEFLRQLVAALGDTR